MERVGNVRNKEKTILAIEELIGEDPVGRGIKQVRERGRLTGALGEAAHSLLKAEATYIVTGFHVVTKRTVETDGLLGAIFLGRALKQLGKEVYFIHDPETLRPLWDGIAAANFLPTLAVQLTRETMAAKKPEGLLKIAKSACLVAIERHGRAADGNYYTMKGVKIEPSPAPLDQLFLNAYNKEFKDVTTISCADGLNEIGMNNVPRDSNIQAEERIHSIVPVNHLVVAGTANWAAYGLIAALSVLESRNALLQTEEEEEKVLKAVVDAGAVNEITFESGLTVDTLPLNKHQEIVRNLRLLLQT